MDSVQSAKKFSGSGSSDLLVWARPSFSYLISVSARGVVRDWLTDRTTKLSLTNHRVYHETFFYRSSVRSTRSVDSVSSRRISTRGVPWKSEGLLLAPSHPPIPSRL